MTIPEVSFKDYTAKPGDLRKGESPASRVWTVTCPRHPLEGTFLLHTGEVGWFERAGIPRDEEKWNATWELKRLAEAMFPKK